MHNNSYCQNNCRTCCDNAKIGAMTAARASSSRTAGRSRLFYRMPHYADPYIHWSLLILAVYGLLMIASASMGLAIGQPGYLAFVIAKQAVFLIAGYFSMTYLANRFSLNFLKSRDFPKLAVAMVFALLACLAFPRVNGARAWIRVPVSSLDISIQPSEFTKALVPLIIAAYCGDVTRHYEKGRDLWLRPFLFVLLFVFIIFILQSDFGSMAVVLSISLVCFMVPQNPAMRKLQRAIGGLILAVLALIIYILTPAGIQFVEKLPLADYQKNRFVSAFNPFADQYDTGYQLINGLISFASGGWTGLGFGNSVRKYTRFPAANTDFILAIVIEEMGIFGFLLIFIPYLIILCRLFHYALRMKSEKGRIILIGTAMYLLIHCLFNIGGGTAMIPLTGVPLLMISSGGSSTLAFMISLGLSQAVISQYRKGLIQ